MKIKLIKVSNIDGLFKVIDQCEDRVELFSDDIILNLKSKLAQYFSLAKLFSDGEIPELELITYNNKDSKKLIDFMVNGDGLCQEKKDMN